MVLVRHLILFLVGFSFYSCNEKEFKHEPILIYMTGVNNIGKKFNLKVLITDSLDIGKLISYRDTLIDPLWNCGQKPVLWDLLVRDSANTTQLYSITSYGRIKGPRKIIIRKDHMCYGNESLVNYVQKVIKFDFVKYYPGDLTQEVYDEVFKIVDD